VPWEEIEFRNCAGRLYSRYRCYTRRETIKESLLMSSKPQPNLVLRTAVPEDGPACGQICYDAFSTISAAHGFPCDFPGPEHAIGVLSMMFSAPGFYCVVAEHEGRIVGSNCLDERSVIAGIGPITVDPGAQNLGIGRGLMQVAMDRANERGAAGIRLVQAAFHNRSLSLYAGLGFDIRNPLPACRDAPSSEVLTDVTCD
jgi:GNAT superfamily N-acetyltransferase